MAGRIAVLELLPLSYKELTTFGNYAEKPIWDLVYHGLYPGTFVNNTPIDMWHKSYITTYLERDVRQLLQVKDISKFHLFLRLCAGRNAQIRNMSEIASACGTSHTTIGKWLSILEASYIIFRLQPYYQNFNKRLVKSPKLYFYDSGLVAHLLGIDSAKHAEVHSARGSLFEGFVISEVYKQIVSQGKTPNIFFWNAHKSFEVDLLVDSRKGRKNICYRN